MTDEAPLPVTGEEAAPGMGCVWVSSRMGEDGAGGLSCLERALEVSPCLELHWRTQILVCKYSTPSV